MEMGQGERNLDARQGRESGARLNQDEVPALWTVTWAGLTVLAVSSLETVQLPAQQLRPA